MTDRSSTNVFMQNRGSPTVASFPWLFLGVVTIIVGACIVYLPAMRGEFILDDDLLVQNDLIKDPAGLYRIWFTTDAIDYWPLSNSTLWLEWRLWELNPAGYHVTNLILHIGVALLVWAVLRSLSIPGAFLAALLFAVHPVNVESVAWISQRKTIMAALFFLLSILLFLKADPSEEPAESHRLFAPGRGPWYWLSLASFFLGMLSKGSIATLPLVLLLVEWWRHRQLTAGNFLRTAPFFAAAVPLVLINIWFRTHGVETVFRSAGFPERLAGACAVPWFYLSKAILPLNLAFIYPLWRIDVTNPLWWLPLLASVALTALLWSQRQREWVRALLCGWIFFWLALVPVLGFVDVSYMEWSLVADHYQYVAIVAVVALVAAGWSTWYRAQPTLHWATLAVAAMVVGLLMLLSWQQSRQYRDAVTLYGATIENNPSAWMAMNNLGNALVDHGESQKALEQFQKTLQLKPDYAPAYYNRGNALVNLGRTDEGVKSLEQALQLKPDFAQAHYNLGNVLLDLGQTPDAIAHLDQAVTLKPDYTEAHNNLASALRRANRLPEAIEHLQLAVRLNPKYIEAWANLASAASDAQRRPEAIAAGEQALQLARSQGKSTLARELETWLTSYRASTQNPPTDPATPPAP